MGTPNHTEPDYFATQVLSAKRFYLELNLEAGREARLLSGGFEICAPDFDLRRNSVPFLTLEVIVKGEGVLTLKRRQYALSPGTVCIYGKNTAHRLRASPAEGMSKYFIAVKGKQVEDWMAEAGLRTPSVFQIRNLAEVSHLCEVMTTTGRGDSHDRQRLCIATFQHLIMRLGVLMKNDGAHGTAATLTYQRCQKLIEENYLRLNSVQEIANECHIAPEYLCRLFRRFGRQTPYQYLQSLKMNQAVELLSDGLLSVKEVAERLNFSDPFHFSRSFRRVYGVPPTHLLSQRWQEKKHYP